MKTTKLFIFHSSEDGLVCETILESLFDEWFDENTKDIAPEGHPVFTRELPDGYSDHNLYYVIRGEVVVPKAVRVTTKYTL